MFIPAQTECAFVASGSMYQITIDILMLLMSLTMTMHPQTQAERVRSPVRGQKLEQPIN